MDDSAEQQETSRPVAYRNEVRVFRLGLGMDLWGILWTAGRATRLNHLSPGATTAAAQLTWRPSSAVKSAGWPKNEAGAGWPNIYLWHPSYVRLTSHHNHLAPLHNSLTPETSGERRITVEVEKGGRKKKRKKNQQKTTAKTYVKTCINDWSFILFRDSFRSSSELWPLLISLLTVVERK